MAIPTQYINPLHTRSFLETGYTSLGGAVVGSSTRYRLNQPVYAPTSKFHAQMGRKRFEDIVFDWIGGNGHGCSMVDLKARGLASLMANMKGGADRPFSHAPDVSRITFHILWPGYTSSVVWARSIDIATSGPITRARLAQLVAEQFINFLEKARQIPSTQLKDHIGYQGVRSEHLHLVSLQNVIDNNFQATVVIDMR